MSTFLRRKIDLISYIDSQIEWHAKFGEQDNVPLSHCKSLLKDIKNSDSNNALTRVIAKEHQLAATMYSPIRGR